MKCISADIILVNGTNQPTNNQTTKKTHSPDGKVISQTTNLSRLPSNFHFFLGVSIFLKLINLRNNIEWKWMCKNTILGSTSFQIDSCSILQFIHSRLSCSTGRLIGTHDYLFETKEFMKRPKCHETNGGGTIGIGNEFALFRFLSVNLGNDKRNLWLVPKRRLHISTVCICILERMRE